MKILNSRQTKQLDQYTIDNEPILSISLMERAARQCADWIINKYPRNTHVSIFSGPGNNGGDGLAIARMLCDEGYSVRMYICGSKLSKDALTNHERLLIQKLSYIKFIIHKGELPRIKSNEIIIDALFGSGLSRPLDGIFYDIIQFLNRASAPIISIDIPSGFFSEDNSALTKSEQGGYTNAIKATYTLSLELPFLSLFFPDSQHHLGELEILPIGLSKVYLQEIETDYYYIGFNAAQECLQKRNKFDHKGNFGHALIIAGSYGKMGAAVLSCKSCLRTGVGLLTAHIPASGYEIMQTAVPEAMVCTNDAEKLFCSNTELSNFNAIGIGPGIGTGETAKNILVSLLNNFDKPIVIDADAINILSENPNIVPLIPKNSILTPHLGEFRRLVGESNSYYERLKMQIDFSVKYGIYIVLKGHNTCVTTPRGKCFFNSTGNPGMATAGSGDVLTGVITSLLAQNYDTEKAAILGVYLHGMAGDIAEKELGQQALIAGDIINNIGKAYKELN